MGEINGYIDLPQVILYAFWIFFFGLVLYLHRESKREGYPLVSDRSRHITVVGFPGMPEPKEYILPHGMGTRIAPRPDPEPYPLAAKPAGNFYGAPLQPTGDPMVDAVGPSSYSIRPEQPDLTYEGTPRIVPTRVATDYDVAAGDPDPRGKQVHGADGKVAGKVTDIWVDLSEPHIRYLEVDIGERTVLLPMNYVRVSRVGDRISVVSILAKHFENVPAIANPDQVTLQEEDKITGYYGGGHLYATPERAGPLL